MGFLVTLILVALVSGFLVYFWAGRKREPQGPDTGLQLILQQLNEISRVVDSKIGESQKEMRDSMKFHSTESNKIIRDVTERLTRLDETNKQVISFADQLQSLENI